MRRKGKVYNTIVTKIQGLAIIIQFIIKLSFLET